MSFWKRLKFRRLEEELATAGFGVFGKASNQEELMKLLQKYTSNNFRLYNAGGDLYTADIFIAEKPARNLKEYAGVRDRFVVYIKMNENK